MVAYAGKLSPWEVEARGLGVQGQPGLRETILRKEKKRKENLIHPLKMNFFFKLLLWVKRLFCHFMGFKGEFSLI